MEESTTIGPSQGQPITSNVAVASVDFVELDIDDPQFFEKLKKGIDQMLDNMLKFDYNATVAVHNETVEMESVLRPSFLSAVNALAHIVHREPRLLK